MMETSKRKRAKKLAESGTRGREIAEVLLRHHLERGVTPEKLRLMLEELGPTFVKLGQIMSMRTDFLPPSYCKELEKLRADVAPMPFSQVRQAVEEALGGRLEDHFARFDETPVGSASVAQVHRACLPGGQEVVCKVQRLGIRKTMEEDISLLKKAAPLTKLVGLDKTVDLGMVLGEMWETTKEEMDFRLEAANLREFAEKNANIRCIACPKVFGEVCCETVLTMEYVDGLSLKDPAVVRDAGYDLRDIGDKLAANYVKQIVDDGFFHADPHPGNIRIREGQIVWIDMGMMGRLTQRDRKLLSECVRAVSAHDVESLRRVVMAMGKITGPVDSMQLTADIDDFLSRYESVELGGLDMSVFLKELLDMCQRNSVAMPSGMTMLARGAMTIEGVLRLISPETSIMAIVTSHLAGRALDNIDVKKETVKFAGDIHASLRKAVLLPSQLSDLLRTGNKGQARLNVTLDAKMPVGVSDRSMARLTRGLISAALLLGGCVLSLFDGSPGWLGLPLPAWLALLAGGALGVSACWPIGRKK